MNTFHQIIKIFEMKSTNASNLYDLMIKLKTQLENRTKHNFFGSKVNENLKNFPIPLQKSFKNDAIKCYDRALDYLEKHFDFNNSPFKMFKCLNLDNNLKFEDINNIIKTFHLVLNNDDIF